MKIVGVMELEGLEVINLGVKCKKCGKTWGIRLDRKFVVNEQGRTIEVEMGEKTDLTELPESYFICQNCRKNK